MGILEDIQALSAEINYETALAEERTEAYVNGLNTGIYLFEKHLDVVQAQDLKEKTESATNAADDLVAELQVPSLEGPRMRDYSEPRDLEAQGYGLRAAIQEAMKRKVRSEA